MWVACKLPHGLTIRHKGQEINLNGPNEGYDPTFLAPNGRVNDGENRSGGFGLTDDQYQALGGGTNKSTDA